MLRLSRLWHFYLRFAALPTGLLTFICIVLFINLSQAGSYIHAPLLLLKGFTDLIIWWMVTSQYAKKLFYYYNLHLSSRLMWGFAFTLDILLFELIINTYLWLH